MTAWRTQPAIPVLTNGTYPGYIKDLEVQPSNFPKGKDRLKWTFGLVTATHEYETVTWTATTFHDGDPEFKWAEAALGRKLGTNEPLEADDLLDKRVRVKITPTTGKREGSIFYNVEAVFPPESSEDNEAGMIGQSIDPDEEPFDKF